MYLINQGGWGKDAILGMHACPADQPTMAWKLRGHESSDLSALTLTGRRHNGCTYGLKEKIKHMD